MVTPGYNMIESSQVLAMQKVNQTVSLPETNLRPKNMESQKGTGVLPSGKLT